MGIGAATRRSTPQTTVVGTPSTTATVVTSETMTNAQNAPPDPTGSCPLQNYPVTGNPPQQPLGYAYPPKQY